MRILVTGGSGFLGCRLVERLDGQHEVVATYANERPRTATADWVRFACSGNASDVPDVGDVDVIIHLAQSRKYRQFPAEAGDMFGANVASMHALLEYARHRGVRQFIFASTGSVYAPSENPIAEDAAIAAPDNYYAASKRAAEILAQPYRGLFDVCILRLFYLYGPGQHGRLVPNLMEALTVGRPITLQGSPDGMLVSPTHVDDVVEVFVQALEQRWTRTFNVSSPEVLSMRQLGETIGQAIGVTPEYAVDTSVPAQNVVPALARLGTCFDPREFRPFSAGMQDTAARWLAERGNAGRSHAGG